MNIINKLIKICAILIVMASSAFVALIAYERYELDQRDNAELTYATKDTWTWHDEYKRIQIHYDKELDKSTLRKVNTHSSYVVYAIKSNDRKLETLVQFITKCTPNTKIETSRKYSNGQHITLSCNKNGTALSYNAVWGGADTDFVWNEDLDGFKFNVDFGDWDFTKLDQETTLSKAK
ncbi:hypothetical protein [Aeromonas media]|uniref:hypothetical protein n=1 Tax=Aeromonas media TaxID=651 RepID=UPI002240E052|nr:hypothetical protein [Aeromonas media]